LFNNNNNNNNNKVVLVVVYIFQSQFYTNAKIILGSTRCRFYHWATDTQEENCCGMYSL